MSLLSLEKYLYSDLRTLTAGSDSRADGSGYYELACCVLLSVSRTVLAAEHLSDIAEQVEQLRADLQPGADGESLAQAAQRFQVILQTFKGRLQRLDRERADDFRNILSILNEAFASLDSGGERAGVRFKHIERSLHDATKIEDLRRLKLHLSDVLRFVREESEDESRKTRTALEALGAQLEVAHQAAAKFSGGGLRGREHGLAYLAEAIDQRENSEALYAGLFVADALRAVRSRHGNQVCETLLNDISQKLIHQLLPDARVFEWSSDAVLMVWRSAEKFTAVSQKIRTALNHPFENRAFVGTRVANFSISVRSLLLEARGRVDGIVSKLEQFGTGAFV
ncbi:MAG: hypothetical protein JO217_00315 [Acidobacteriaceae bacterium]|nr:hypothetical protein [Acidobacteriaceae bacterium]